MGFASAGHSMWMLAGRWEAQVWEGGARLEEEFQMDSLRDGETVEPIEDRGDVASG